MKRNKEKRKRGKSIAEIVQPVSEKSRLYRRTWRNWFFLTSVLILTTIGLATAIPPLLSERIVNPWPWVKTDLVLLVGLSLTVLVFIGYMTQQQRHVIMLHQKLESIQTQSDIRIKQHAERLYALTSVGHIMGVETNLQSIFNAITQICAEIFQSDRASLMLCDAKKQNLVVKSACGRSSEEILYIHQRIGDGIAGWVAEHKKPLLLNSPEDYKAYPDLEFKNAAIVSAMVTPIMVRNELVGVLNVSSRSPDIKYESDDLRALQVLAENAGVCIRHTEHIYWIKKIAPILNNGGDKRMHTTECAEERDS